MSNNRSTKRLFAVALSLIMVLALLPVTALAANIETECTVVLDNPGPFPYTGSAIEPIVTVTVTAGGAELTLDEDYTVSYENNINAGTATVIVTGAEPHTGEKREDFTIEAEAVNPTFAATTVPVGTNDAAAAADLGESVLPTSGSITAGGNTVEYTIVWGAQTLDLTAAGNTQTFSGDITYTDAGSYTWLILPGNLTVSRVVTVEAASYIPPQVNLPHKPQVIAASGSSGVAVSGNLSQGATVTASEASLDTVGSNAGAQFVTALAGGEKTLLGITEVKINGTFSGKLSVTLPVDPQYNGQTVTVLHYTSAGKLETYTAVVVNGAVTVEVSSLSPFAVLINSKLVNEDGPDLDEPTPDDDLPGEDEDDLDIEEDEDIVDDDIVEDVPGTGDSAVNAAWTVLVSTLVLGAAVAFVMKKKAADNR